METTTTADGASPGTDAGANDDAADAADADFCPVPGRTGNEFCDDFDHPYPTTFWVPEVAPAKSANYLDASADPSAPSAPNSLVGFLAGPFDGGATIAHLRYSTANAKAVSCSISVDASSVSNLQGTEIVRMDLVNGTTRRFISFLAQPGKVAVAALSEYDGANLATRSLGPPIPLQPGWARLAFTLDATSATVTYAGEPALSTKNVAPAFDAQSIEWSVGPAYSDPIVAPVRVKYDDAHCTITP